METESFKLKKETLMKVKRIVYTQKADGVKITIGEWIDRAIKEKISKESGNVA